MTRRPALFVASCVSLVTTAMVFAIRGDAAEAIAADFHLTHTQLGLIFSPAFWCFTVAILVSGALVDLVGLRTLHVLSALGYLAGIALIALAPHPTGPCVSLFASTGTIVLYAGFMLLGLSQGLVEGVINPLVATLYPQEKTRRLNRLHAWWPGGLIIGGLAAYVLTAVFHAPWQMKMSLILVPAATYLVLALMRRYPVTERVQARIPSGEMWRETLRPGFLVLFLAMWMTAALELGPDQWFPSVMGTLVPKLQGVLYLVYTSGVVFLLRTFGGGVAQRSPVWTLLTCSAAAAAGLYWQGSLHAGANPFMAFLAATLFAAGKSFFWPTMLGLTAERFPRGGALTLSLMGGAGMLSGAIALPLMGEHMDRHGPGAALQLISLLAVPLVVIFVCLVRFRHPALFTEPAKNSLRP